jgi:hypothetical protein
MILDQQGFAHLVIGKALERFVFLQEFLRIITLALLLEFAQELLRRFALLYHSC